MMFISIEEAIDEIQCKSIRKVKCCRKSRRDFTWCDFSDIKWINSYCDSLGGPI